MHATTQCKCDLLLCQFLIVNSNSIPSTYLQTSIVVYTLQEILRKHFTWTILICVLYKLMSMGVSCCSSLCALILMHS